MTPFTFNFFRVVTVAGLVAAAVHAVPAFTETARNCGPRALIIDRLADGYGETRQSIGLGANGHVVEVFASTDSRSWTLTATDPSGVTCLIASGQHFARLSEALPPQGDPT